MTSLIASVSRLVTDASSLAVNQLTGGLADAAPTELRIRVNPCVNDEKYYQREILDHIINDNVGIDESSSDRLPHLIVPHERFWHQNGPFSNVINNLADCH